jgi:capsular polysaccharide biosynthesis protein
VAILSERARERTKYKIIEPARIPLAPFWPDQRKIMALGVLLGLIVGGAAIFLVEMFDHSFKRVEDVQEVLQLPVLATIPRIEKLTFRW